MSKQNLSRTLPATPATLTEGSGGEKHHPHEQQQQQQQQTMREIALSLHDRLLRMRETVAVVPVSAELPMLDSGAQRPTGHHDVTSGLHTPSGFLEGLKAAEGGDGSPGPAATASIPPAAGAASSGGGGGDGGGGGTELGLLTVTGELGRGAQGVVYRGRWRGIDVAVKSMLLHGQVGVRAAGEEVRRGAGGGEARELSPAAPVTPRSHRISRFTSSHLLSPDLTSPHPRYFASVSGSSPRVGAGRTAH